MFMARQPVQPPLNLPQAIVEFVELIRDPSWLPKFVAAAEAVTDANKLTAEEAQHLADAQCMIEEASGLKKKQVEENNLLTSWESRLAQREEKAANREKQCDERNTAIAGGEKKLSDLAQQIAQQQTRLDNQAKQQKVIDDAQQKRGIKLEQWEAELAEQEKAFDSARSLVTKKKAGQV